MSEYTFFVANVSGAGVADQADDLTVHAVFEGVSISGSATITQYDGNFVGYYSVDLGTLDVGHGLVKLVSSTYTVTPQWYEVNNDSVTTTDDVYGVIISSVSAPVTITTASRYGTINLNIKEGDDVLEALNVPARHKPLSGWTDLTCQIYDSSSITTSGGTLLGTGTVTITDATNGVIQVHIPRSVTSDVVPEGSANTTIYADIQGKDTSGYIFSLVEMTMSVRREFNKLS